jgi:cytochrome c oxidase assembly protein subunit 15
MTGRTASLANDGLHRGTAAARWRHHLALATAVATFVLLLIGGGVTSSDVGMADPLWPTPPWYLLVVSSLHRGLGFIVEHGHRAWGYLVGLLTLILCSWMWLGEPRRLLRWLATAALLGVIAQGVLGGLRVLLNVQAGHELALVHGCFAQAFFALVCALALASAPRWTVAPRQRGNGIASLRRLALLTCGLVYVQLILGASLRHLGIGLALHLIAAVAVTAHGTLLAWRVAHLDSSQSAMKPWAKLLAGLLATQLALGLAAWATSNGFGRYAFQSASGAHILLATAHVGVGAMILVTALVLTLKLYRHWEPAAQLAPLPLTAPAEVPG